MNKTEKQICSSLIEVLKEKELNKVKVIDVVKKADISRTTFYVYYESVFDVLQDIEDEILSHIISEDQIKMNNSEEILFENFSYIRDNLDVLEALLGPNGDPSFEARLSRRSRKVLSNFDQNSSLKLSENQLAIVNEFTRAGKIQVLRWWNKNIDEVSVREVVEMFDTMTTAINKVLFDNK